MRCKYINGWRRKTMSDLTGAFGPARSANLPSVVPPTTEQYVPHQEHGTRPRVGGYPYAPPLTQWKGTQPR